MPEPTLGIFKPCLTSTLRLLFTLLAVTPALTWADNLVSVYQQALDADPQYQAALQTYKAALEVLPQSRATLLPGVTLGADVSRNRFDPRNTADTTYATNQTYRIGLRQTLYHRERFLLLKQADSRIALAEAELESAYQDLILRVATRYFLELGAQDSLEFVRADKEAVARTLEQAEQRFRVGLAAITDTLEAQARFDISVSDEINAVRQLADAEEALRELTGQLPVALEHLLAEIPLLAPEPSDQEEWVSAAIKQNPSILAARAATHIAKQEIQVQSAGHFPTLEMTADYSYRDTQFGGFTPLERNDSAIGLQMNLPLYQGGLISSRTRQSRFQYNQALDAQEQQRRTTERETRNNYRGVISGISRVEALRKAVLSNEKAVEAAKAGFEVGTRAVVYVLDAQRELLRARRDYARSRYDYLLDTLRLKQSAGILGETDLPRINNWLKESKSHQAEQADKRTSPD